MSSDDESNLKLSFSDAQQIERINNLAQEYYNYYVQNGTFPSEGEDVKFISSTDFGTVLTIKKPLNLSNSYAAVSSVGILSGLGLSFTEATLAKRLVSLGIITAVDGPLPIGDFIALLAGVVIVGAHVYKYTTTTTSTAISNDIKIREGATFSTKAIQALTMSKTLSNSSNQTRFFAAQPFKGGGGGIILTEPIVYTVACLRAVNLLDTYAKTRDEARAVAQSATTPGLSPIQDVAHVYNEKNKLFFPNNKPHFHALESAKVRKDGHHWFN